MYSIPFTVLGEFHGIGLQFYDLRSDDFGLLSASGEWTDDAYRVRNSNATIRQIPPSYLKDVIAGFRNIEKGYYVTGNFSITISAVDDPRYCRGLIIRKGKELVLCGIGYQAEISGPDMNKVKIERGYWKTNKFHSLGGPFSGRYVQNDDLIRIIFDADDMSGSHVFEPMKKQSCVRLRL